MKNIKKLNRKQQKQISGGAINKCSETRPCFIGYCCQGACMEHICME